MRRQTPPSPLKVARERACLTQVGLAKLLGVHPASISLAERGALSANMARRCAAALGVPAEDLLDETSTTPGTGAVSGVGATGRVGRVVGTPNRGAR